MPYMVPRWSKDAGEIYGRSPGWNALPDQKMLNEMSRTVLKAAQKAVDPPLMVADDGVLMPLRTHPGGINVVRAGALSNDPLRPLRPEEHTSELQSLSRTSYAVCCLKKTNLK